jgi:hypothetical protein
LLRRDGEWLRCAEPHCGDRAFWGAWRPAAFLRVKVAAHRAKMHNGAAAAGRPQRRVAAAAAALPAGMTADMLAALAAAAVELARTQAWMGNMGIARRVKALGPKFVVKFAAGQMHHTGGRVDGRKHNQQEWADFHAAPADLRKWLCPPILIAPDGEWMIVRRAELVGHVPHDQYTRLRAALRGKVEDLHLNNVGMLDGEPVAIDYGFGVGRAVRI